MTTPKSDGVALAMMKWKRLWPHDDPNKPIDQRRVENTLIILSDLMDEHHFRSLSEWFTREQQYRDERKPPKRQQPGPKS